MYLMSAGMVSNWRQVLLHDQGCDTSFSKELSSEFKLPGHLELQFRSSSSYGMRELSYSSVQFHLLGLAS